MKRINRPIQRLSLLASSIVTLSIVATYAQAEGPAGMVLYCCHGQHVFLLLADHSNNSRGWASFGGGAHAGETRQQTAARETEEETRGYFSRIWLAQQIADQKPVVSHGFSFYFAEVPFVPAQRIMNNPTDESDKSKAERKNYAWIPFSELEKALSKNKPSAADLKLNPLYLPRETEEHSLWGVWVRNMRDAMIQDAFPQGWEPTMTEPDIGQVSSEGGPSGKPSM